jgi:CheY-like chemotaxis protein
MLATVVCPGIAPPRSAPPSTAPWLQPKSSAEGDRKGTDTSRFVLIVDDDPDLLDVTSFVIESEGMAVETARNGEEALALLRAGRVPELVLLDLMMPVMNGWEFRAEQEKDPALLAIPVIVISADNNLSEKARAFGGNYLSKPLDIDDLLEEIGRIA